MGFNSGFKGLIRHGRLSGEIRKTYAQEKEACMYILYRRYLILPSESKNTTEIGVLLSARLHPLSDRP